MAKMIQIPYDNQVVIPQQTAQAVQDRKEEAISLKALGLLVNLLSYPTTWELHKTELYKRYGKDGEKSVKSAWDDLVKANYIIEFKYRVGRSYEYVYYIRKVPFTDGEISRILDLAEKEYGEIWGLRFGESNSETSKGRGNQKPLLNKKPLLNDDDDKRTSPPVESSPVSNEPIETIIEDMYTDVKDELAKRSFDSVVRKVIRKHKQGEIGEGKFREYLATSLSNKIAELELRREQEKAEKVVAQPAEPTKQRKSKPVRKEVLPYWFEEVAQPIVPEPQELGMSVEELAAYLKE